MVLVQMMLPLYDSDGQRVPHTLFAELRDELTEHFGGVTAFTRAPAEGTWKEDTGEVDRDEVVMCEVMVDPLERAWWADYRKKLERPLRPAGTDDARPSNRAIVRLYGP